MKDIQQLEGSYSANRLNIYLPYFSDRKYSGRGTAAIAEILPLALASHLSSASYQADQFKLDLDAKSQAKDPATSPIPPLSIVEDYAIQLRTESTVVLPIY